MSKFTAIRNELKTHWKTPDTEKGKYVSWREHLDIFIGVCMNYAAQAPLGYIGFGMSCYLIMYHYKLPYLCFSIIGLIGIPLSYLWSILGWVVADNLGILPKEKERKFYAFYIAATALGLLLIIFDASQLLDQGGRLVSALNSLEGISARSFFKILGIQLFVNAFGGARAIFWRKKLVPKYGRYKFHLYCNVIQKCICVVLMGWLPIYNVVNVDERVWMAYLLFSVFSMYDFGNKLEDCTTIISPNSQERLWVRSYTVKISHLLNSVFVGVIPMLGHFDDINFYRWVIPCVFIPCAALTMLTASKITERIPQPPIEKKQSVPFWYGVFEVMRNKYNWFNTLAGVIDSLGNGALHIPTIVYLYTLRLSGLEYSLLTLLYTSRTTLCTFIAPFVIKRFSFKTLRIFKQFIEIATCVVSIIVLSFFADRVVFCGIILYIMQLVRGFCVELPNIAINDMNVRLKDYQMYLSGERMENLTNIFSWFSSPITTLVGLIIPVLLLTNGFNTNWDVLLLDTARFNILAVPFIFDLIGHVFIVIPYLFWDYNNTQHEY
ncbi:MAG: hypothetical protein GX851_02410, partial [Clostridiales bacterium]|nr:hypothetical protein [Clostridiales bacterium]